MKRRLGTTLVLALALAATAGPVGSSDDSDDGADPFTVMTRNLYLGVDLLPLVSSANIGELAQNAAAAFAVVEATDFPTRAEALADEIAEHEPALIGLQEVALWRTSEEGVMDGPLSPAEVVVADFLDVLSGALAARGLEYTIAAQQETFDAEVPSGLDLDVRLTMRNAILADAGAVEVTGASDGLFVENSSFETLFGALVDTRGWTAVDAVVDGQPMRLINTHLDPYDPAVRALQGQELLDGPAATDVPVVLLGDLNAEVSMPTMEALFGAGFSDGWGAAGEAPGETCCFSQDLADPGTVLDQRIDYVLVSDGLEVIAVERVGADEADRIGGLWPSDHAGVVADVTLEAAEPGEG